jgi:uncharacterized membrane protein
MCVDSRRDGLFGRAEFFAVAAAAAAPLVIGSRDPAAALEVPAVPPVALPPAPPNMTRGNARAAALAARSPFVRRTYGRIETLATSIGDAALRTSVLALLHDPQPLYARNHPSPESRVLVRDQLARAGFVAADAPVSQIFPPGTEAGIGHAPQPFWAVPGSGQGSHHAYPGGLAVHEGFNASMAEAFAQNYDRRYFSDTRTVDRDLVVGAALYHDIMKSVIYQWNADGTITDEPTIAGTQAHHALSGAEAITRGRSARFVVTLLSAHAAPSLGDETKVVAWCRAAAIVAGVDPVAFGLLERSGTTYTLAEKPAPIEAFISNLSDHDYVVSVHAYHETAARLTSLMTRSYASFASEPHWFHNAVFSQTSAIRLYRFLGTGGEAAFADAVAQAVQLSGIGA